MITTQHKIPFAFLRAPALWGILVATLLTLPGISSYDFQLTDYTQIAVVSGVINYPGMSSWNLYHFADGVPEHTQDLISRNFVPWFTSLHWKFNFCRHIPSLLIAAHYQLFGLNLPSYPIHSLLWLLLMIFFLAKFVTFLFPDEKKTIPLLAVLIFSLSPANMPAIFYSAGRYMFTVGVFCLAGLLAHIKWREQQWKPGRILSILAFLLALISAEASLAGITFLFCYELFYSDDSMKERLRALLPLTVLLAAYLCFYKLVGYGTGGQDAYVNPFAESGRFLRLLPERLEVLAADMMFRFDFLRSRILPKHPLLVGGLGLMICCALLVPAWLESDRRSRRRINCLLASSLLSLIPLSSGTVAPRLTIIPAIGASIILAVMMNYWLQKFFEKERQRSLVTWLGTIFILGLAYLHFLNPPIRMIMGISEYKEEAAFFKKFHEQKVLQSISADQQFFFLNYSDWMDPQDELFYRLIHRMPVPEFWRQLSFTAAPQSLIRTGDKAFQLSASEGNITDNGGSITSLRNQDEPFRAGDEIHLPEVRIIILKTDGFAPTQVEFQFQNSLGDERYRFFKFVDGLLVRINLPKPGGSISF